MKGKVLQTRRYFKYLQKWIYIIQKCLSPLIPENYPLKLLFIYYKDKSIIKWEEVWGNEHLFTVIECIRSWQKPFCGGNKIEN